MVAAYSDAEVRRMVERCDARDRYVAQHTCWPPEGGPANVTRCYYDGPVGRYALCWERSALGAVVQVWREEPAADFDPTCWPG